MAAPDGSGHCCHRCGADIGRIERVGRRDACLACGADLHCCRNCRFYTPGHHNDCLENQAERQVDKVVGNFCDFFAFRAGAAASTKPVGSDARSKLDTLFAKRK
jgi:hypothetical protein